MQTALARCVSQQGDNALRDWHHSLSSAPLWTPLALLRPLLRRSLALQGHGAPSTLHTQSKPPAPPSFRVPAGHAAGPEQVLHTSQGPRTLLWRYHEPINIIGAPPWPVTSHHRSHGLIESLRFEKTSKITRSNRQPSTTPPAKPCPEVPRLHSF